MAVSWPINGGDPNYRLTGMFLQVRVSHHFGNGGSFWMMINPYYKNGGSCQPTPPKKTGGWNSTVMF